jgi:hypothetical protein
MADIEPAMNLVSLSPQDDLADLVPEFWKDLFFRRKASLFARLLRAAGVRV